MSAPVTPNADTCSMPKLITRSSLLSVLGIGCYVLSLLGFGWPLSNVLIILAIFIAATVASVAGFAFSVICAPLLLPIVAEPIAMVQILLVSSLAIQAMSLWRLRSQVEWRRTIPLVLGGAVLLPLSLSVLAVVPREAFGRIVGLILIVQGSWLALLPVRQVPRPIRLIEALVAGAGGGITGGLLASPGLPVAAWCAWSGWPRQQQRGVFAPYILMMQVLTLLLLWALAPAKSPADSCGWDLLTYIPPALAGAVCGLQAFHRISDRHFGFVINGLLLAAGVALLLR